MKRVSFTVLCLLFFARAFSQITKPAISLDDIVAHLQTLSTTKAAENVYLHFDRARYNAGDTIYFKAYLTLGEQHQLSKLNGVLHVDLLNKADSLVKNIELQTNNGLAWGDFALAKNLPKGIYHIRAYTRWMLNNADANIFDKPVTINSTVPETQALSTRSTKITNKFDIQFFAEGGTFVDDIPAKLAFKAVDEHGVGVDVKGVVVDNLNTEVTKFEAKHLGMGIIFITPVEGRTYKAKLTYADGTKATVDLPRADVKGMTMLVNNDSPGKLLIEINASKAYYIENKNKEISVVIYSNGSVRSVKTVLDSQVLDLNLAKKDFQIGVVQVTLFSNTGEPMNERLAFIQNNDLINIQTASDKPTYAASGKVHITLNAKKDDKPVAGYFSASVIDATKIPVDESAEATILTHLLLTSQLKGVVEQPNYYFANVTNDTRANLDVLMLTQGYRRFEWKQLLGAGAATAATYPVEKGIDISGSITLKDGTPVENGSVTLLTQSGGNMLSQTTDANGKFTFPNLVYDDNTPFVIQAKTSTGKSNVLITMDEQKPLPVTGNVLPELTATAALLKPNGKTQPVFLADASGKMLKEVVVADKSYIGPDHASQTISNNQIRDQGSLANGLAGRLNGVAIRGGVPYLTDKVSELMQGGPMLIVLDDVAQADGTGIDDYNIVDIESVKVLKNNDAAIYGVRGANGVLLIKTIKNKSMPINKTMAPGLITYAPKGFYKARTFYSPAYGGSTPNAGPDDRRTIYWNPDLVTDKDGSASFDYFNANGKGNYRVVIEGIDENGNLGRGVYVYKVE
ncbi:carboxypeptidase regulatory-like domain-containing protein [Mucilaginibacter dorajii]|uniref:TonB-dependent receptor plug domain-containing protein n=1 Tax=Mucilaginibacter dorajii TaxID=692994 RepID=A0ABP7QEP9_9SPHI|nr:carboxypeptidase regulatory-like domain-containing protein [Mucilaginibacter dorajii]MCS3733331.1 TonB-dependent SusC/RagA subfamily outer membrane receptor [Mucilaginibacter dorajii]